MSWNYAPSLKTPSHLNRLAMNCPISLSMVHPVTNYRSLVREVYQVPQSRYQWLYGSFMDLRQKLALEYRRALSPHDASLARLCKKTEIVSKVHHVIEAPRTQQESHYTIWAALLQLSRATRLVSREEHKRPKTSAWPQNATLWYIVPSQEEQPFLRWTKLPTNISPAYYDTTVYDGT